MKKIISINQFYSNYEVKFFIISQKAKTYNVEVNELPFVCRVTAEGGIMMSEIFPGSVEVVGHDTHDIEVPNDALNVV